MNRLSGKLCVVTGAGQGIGNSIASAFAAEGARVLAADLKFSAQPTAISAGCITQYSLDVTDASEIERVAHSISAVDVLVNCAGYVAIGNILSCDAKDYQRSFDINTTSIYLMMRAFLPGMIAASAGSIINIASVVSSVMAAPDRFAYAASKAAVIAMTMSVARDFASMGVRCNAISPGTVDSPSLRERMAATGNAEAALKAFINRQISGRLGTPEEIARAAILLASDEARFMTGANVIIDGGMSL
jgi:2-keto-3-deoxy-L-fuconate dehydrogenase